MVILLFLLEYKIVKLDVIICKNFWSKKQYVSRLRENYAQILVKITETYRCKTCLVYALALWYSKN